MAIAEQTLLILISFLLPKFQTRDRRLQFLKSKWANYSPLQVVIQLAGSVVVGGVVESFSSAGLPIQTPSILPTSGFVTNFSATVASNVAGVLFGRTAGNAVSTLTRTILGQAQSPFGMVASQFASAAANVAVRRQLEVPISDN